MARLPTVLTIDEACRVMHDAYEEAAKKEGWETNPASRVDWEDVPEANQMTMRAAVRALFNALGLVPGLPPGFLECQRCGAIVRDIDKHVADHSQTDVRAMQGERAMSWITPIGGEQPVVGSAARPVRDGL